MISFILSLIMYPKVHIVKTVCTKNIIIYNITMYKKSFVFYAVNHLIIDF